MKLLPLILLLIATRVVAQYEIKYDVVTSYDDTNILLKTINKAYLYVDEQKTKYVTDKIVNGKPETINIYKDENYSQPATNIPAHLANEEIQVLVRNFKSDSIRLKLGGSCMSYNYVPNIEILDEYKKIGEYNCQKGKTIIHEREFEVWFTTDVALNIGPWKLYGFPGLVIEAHTINKDSKPNKYHFYLTSIEKYNNPEYMSQFPICRFNPNAKWEDYKNQYYESIEKRFLYRKSKNNDPNLVQTSIVDIINLPFKEFK